MLRRLIRVIKQKRDVWWATASEVATHWLDREAGSTRERRPR